MGFTTFAHDKMLNAFGQAAAFGGPSTLYVGLLTGSTWVSAHAYTSGAYVLPTTFGSLSGQTGRIFKCTTSGTSGGSQPTWPTTAGGTVIDGTVTWTEVTNLFQQGTFTSAEISGNNYSRVAVTPNSTNFPNATNAQPAILQNGTAITFPSPSADWGLAMGFIVADAATVGTIWAWGVTTAALDCPSGSTPSFGINALQIELTP